MKTLSLCSFAGSVLIAFQASVTTIASVQTKLDAIAAGGPDEWFVVAASPGYPERRLRLSAVGFLTVQ